jgi:hypothetical protein
MLERQLMHTSGPAVNDGCQSRVHGPITQLGNGGRELCGMGRSQLTFLTAAAGRNTCLANILELN